MNKTNEVARHIKALSDNQDGFMTETIKNEKKCTDSLNSAMSKVTGEKQQMNIKIEKMEEKIKILEDNFKDEKEVNSKIEFLTELKDLMTTKKNKMMSTMLRKIQSPMIVMMKSNLKRKKKMSSL